MKKRKHPDSENNYRYLRPCSAQDCTGLIPAGPADDGELENYEELYPYLPRIPEGSRYAGVQIRKQ